MAIQQEAQGGQVQSEVLIAIRRHHHHHHHHQQQQQKRKYACACQGREG